MQAGGSGGGRRPARRPASNPPPRPTPTPPRQVVKALAEAEAHPGPSLVIAYSPCAMHGISSMGVSANDAKLAVDSGERPAQRCLLRAAAGRPGERTGRLCGGMHACSQQDTHPLPTPPTHPPAQATGRCTATARAPARTRASCSWTARRSRASWRNSCAWKIGERRQWLRRSGAGCFTLRSKRRLQPAPPATAASCPARKPHLPLPADLPSPPAASWCCSARTRRRPRRCTTAWMQISTRATSAWCRCAAGAGGRGALLGSERSAGLGGAAPAGPASADPRLITAPLTASVLSTAPPCSCHQMSKKPAPEPEADKQ